MHQKANQGNTKLERGWQGHLPSPTSFEDWHWTTQLNQAHAIRFGISHFRSLTPHCTGAVLWQLNDNWPVVSWAAVDHAGHRKPMWHALRDVFAPRLATVQPRASEAAKAAAWEGLKPELDTLALVLLNDTAEAFRGTFTATRQRFDGTVLAGTTLTAEVPARGSLEVVLPTEVAAFEDVSSEVIVVVPDGGGAGFVPAFHNGVEVLGQVLDPEPLSVRATAVDGGVDVTVTATAAPEAVAATIRCANDLLASSAPSVPVPGHR